MKHLLLVLFAVAIVLPSEAASFAPVSGTTTVRGLPSPGFSLFKRKKGRRLPRPAYARALHKKQVFRR
ncbi:hypothetical protein [Hymenobacter sp. AT01-02]|uniref:hypothetical protein n=1 Tax=Hymenobacter sp. AT01-02 TaxID=1571877 RepID=UPI0005F1C48A|nr:hypothetical protein [Hymenobacter sp. AT01-02]